MRLVHVRGEGVSLSRREFEILLLLIRRSGRVLRRQEVLSAIGQGVDCCTPRVVDTHVKNIRRKLGPAGDMIKTLRGVGYVFRPSGEIG
jgi:two-component system phosphate regulon response regulator PhoB